MEPRDIWLLPDGIDELLPEDAEQVENLRRELLDLYDLHGYRYIITPPVEHLDSLLTGTGKAFSDRTFTVTDPASGKLLGFRPDITPQAARVAVHRLSSSEEPKRLCYCDTVLHMKPKRQSKARWLLQAGVEFFGESDGYADLEVITLMVESLQKAGIQNPVVELSHVGLVKEVATLAGLSSDQRKNWYALVQHKDRRGLEAFVSSQVDDAACSSVIAELLVELPFYCSGWNEAEQLFSKVRPISAEIEAYVKELQTLGDSLLGHYPSLTLSVDLGELRGYRYHTGLLFSAYETGVADPIALGGRYDGIGEAFGVAQPATGFSIDLKTLIQVGEKIRPTRLTLLAPIETPRAIADQYRSEGYRVVVTANLDERTKDVMGFLALTDGQWQIKRLKD